MELRRVLEGIEVTRTDGDAPRAVARLSCDSRKAAKGDLFFALPGARTDGALFVGEAFRKGAVAAVVEEDPEVLRRKLGSIAARRFLIRVKSATAAIGRAAANFFGHPSRRLRVIGITGTNGKTTTSYFLESILAGAGRATGVIGTVNYRLNGKELMAAPNTTPLSLELQGLLAKMEKGGADCVAMEVSSHALALGRVDDVEFDVGVFTNLYRDHLDFHKTRDRYFLAKSRLFELLEACRKKGRFAILNADDPYVARLLPLLKKAKAETYGLSPAADHRADHVEATLAGTRFEWVYRRRRYPVHLRLIGRHNVYNALAALGAAVGLGVSPREAVRGLGRLSAVPGRLDPVENRKGLYLFVDYAHTDSALEMVLKQLRDLPHRRIFTVFGCGGDRDKTKRAPMGQAAARWSDKAFVTSDNPRTEDPKRIIADIVKGIKAIHLDNYLVLPDRKEAITRAVHGAGPGDTVLIAGKGHETYQIFKDKTIHFDDKEAAAEALAGRRG